MSSRTNTNKAKVEQIKYDFIKIPDLKIKTTLVKSFHRKMFKCKQKLFAPLRVKQNGSALELVVILNKFTRRIDRHIQVVLKTQENVDC